ncbi:unnamed protein product [Ceratitis capitata]|uniref:(Mediterranean fruit fly) hypothetical protein n=1 Tax=Ceratitis capitata TaxID=7213 RepID=A0A811UUP5_CERCA|nr:unnamed protein product [Ceratitis capitata]
MIHATDQLPAALSTTHTHTIAPHYHYFRARNANHFRISQFIVCLSLKKFVGNRRHRHYLPFGIQMMLQLCCGYNARAFRCPLNNRDSNYTCMSVCKMYF